MSKHIRESLGEFIHALLSTALIVVLVSALIGCTTYSEGNRTVSPLTEKVSFEKQIKPLFESRCVMCHNGQVAAGDLNLLTRDLAFRRSSNGPFIIPGDPNGSKLFRMVQLADVEPGAMPPTGHALDGHQLGLVKAWIEQGAEWPAGEPGYLKPAKGMSWRSR